jgi:hypothetical protein
LKQHLERLQVESKSLESRIDGASKTSTLQITFIVAALQAVAALGIVFFVNRRKAASVDRYEAIHFFAFSFILTNCRETVL